MGDNTLSDKIKEAIQTELSGQVAGELKDFIAEAEMDKEQLMIAKEEIAALDVDREELKDRIRVFEKLELDATQIDASFINLEKGQNDLRRNEEILDIKGAHAQERVEEIRSLVEIIFKNPTVRRRVIDKSSGTDAVTGQYFSNNHEVETTETTD